VLVDRAPQVPLCAVDLDEHLIEVPFVAQPRTTTAQLVRVLLPEPVAPGPDRLIGHVDTTFEHQVAWSDRSGPPPSVSKSPRPGLLVVVRPEPALSGMDIAPDRQAHVWIGVLGLQETGIQRSEVLHPANVGPGLGRVQGHKSLTSRPNVAGMPGHGVVR